MPPERSEDVFIVHLVYRVEASHPSGRRRSAEDAEGIARLAWGMMQEPDWIRVELESEPFDADDKV